MSLNLIEHTVDLMRGTVRAATVLSLAAVCVCASLPVLAAETSPSLPTIPAAQQAATAQVDQTAVEEVATDAAAAQPPAPIVLKPTSYVAPLFLHGSGQGVYSWDAVNTPDYLSEDEARDIILDIARSAGIDFTLESRSLAAIPTADGQASLTRPIVLDGADAARNISFVFISQLDANNWRRKTGRTALGEFIDVLGCADDLRSRLAARNPNGTFVVFYDPAITIADVLPRLNESEYFTTDLEYAAHEMACEQLRQQVNDFILLLQTGSVD